MRWRSGIVLLGMLVACRGEPTERDGLEPPLSQHFAVAATAPYPGGGASVLLRVTNEDGSVPDRDLAADMGIFGAGLVDSQAERVSLTSRHTAIVLLPSKANRAQRDAALGDFIASRPEDERVAIFRWGATIVQLLEFTTDRDKSLEVLEWSAQLEAADDILTPTAAVLQLLERTSHVDGIWRHSMRNLIFVGDAVPGVVPAFASTALTQWVVPTAESKKLESVPSANLHLGSYAAGLEATATQISAIAQAGHLRIAICASPFGQEIRVVSPHIEGPFPLAIEPSLREERSMECDLTEVAGGERRYPVRVDLLFTEEQRSEHDTNVENMTKNDFALSVRWGDREPMTAVAHLRGKGSIGCERKNYTLNLDGKRPRFVMPDSGTDEFYLLSMCLDDRYLRQFTVLRAWKQLGIFHSQLRLIELTLDGETQAFYLLIEKVAEEVQTDNSGVISVLRRGFSPPDTTTEVKYARGGNEDAARADHDAVNDTLRDLAGADLLAKANTFFHVDRYLTWLASNSILHNGDYVDEIWLMQVDRLRPDGSIGGHYGFGGWDAEDVFGDCHYDGKYAFDDEHGLVYCAEAEWDHTLLADSVVYARYVDILEALLDGTLTVDVFDGLLRDTEDQLAAIIDRPGAAAALIRLINDVPEAVDPEVAKAEIRSAGAAMSTDFAERSELLRSRIEAYRSSSAH